MPSRSESSAAAPRPIRLGVIGTGLAVKKLHWPALGRMPERYQIAAFANHTRAAAEEFAQQASLPMDGYHADYDALLARDDVEAVLVSLPISLSYPVTRACLAAGKHVICEKPSGSNLEQARLFLSLAEQFPRQKVLIAENFFYRDDLRLARSLVDEGVIGRLHMLLYRTTGMLVPAPGEFSGTPWRWAPRYRGGPHLDAGVHHVAQIRLLGGDVQSLHAFIQYANPTMGGPSEMTLNLHFVNDAIGSYVALYSPISVPPGGNDTRLFGTDGCLLVERNKVTVVRPDNSTEEHRVEGCDGGYYNEFLNFYDAVVHDEPIVSTIAQNVHNVLLVMRALDSAEGGGVIDLDDAPVPLASPGIPLWRPRGADGLFDGLPSRVIRAASSI